MSNQSSPLVPRTRLRIRVFKALHSINPERTLLWLILAALAPSFGSTAPHSASEEVADRLQAVLDRAVVADRSVPGVLVSISAPSIHLEWTGAGGRLALHDDQKLLPDQPFRIASITKVFVAAAIFRLTEEHRVLLFGPITPYLSAQTLSELRAGGYDPDRITVQQLLAHTSGIYDYASNPAFNTSVIASPRKRWTRSEQIRLAIERGKPVGRPGERFVYSDTGYVILGEIIEHTTQRSLPSAIRELLRLESLSLKSTYFESMEVPPRNHLPLAHQYLNHSDFADIDPSFDLYGGGGLVSTTQDLNRFMRALLQGRLFTLRTTLASALMTVDAGHDAGDHLHANLLTTYPFGRRMCWGHRGVWASEALYCPDIDLALAVTLNQSEALDGPQLKSLLAALAEELERAPGYSQ